MYHLNTHWQRSSFKGVEKYSVSTSIVQFAAARFFYIVWYNRISMAPSIVVAASPPMAFYYENEEYRISRNFRESKI